MIMQKALKWKPIYQVPVSGKSSGTLEDERNRARTIFISSLNHVKAFCV